MTQPEPRVSIGLPVYNGEQFLRRSIDSLLCQTFGDFELIISDNASTDSTPEICRGYAASDTRVRYIAHPVNRGAAWNINHVVELARAPYFTWAHADDMRAPRNLECCVAELDRAPQSVVLACCRSVIIDEHDRPTYPYEDGMDLRQPRPSDRLRLAVRNAIWCNVLFGVMRTSVLRACRPLGGYPYSDLTLIYELAIRGQFWETPDRLFYRREHANTSTRAGVDLMDTAIWMDPQNTGAFILPRCQVFRNSMRAIRAADIPWFEAFRCRMALLRAWPPHYWRQMKHEFNCAARIMLRPVIGAWFAAVALLASAPGWLCIVLSAPGRWRNAGLAATFVVGSAVLCYCGRNAFIERYRQRWGTAKVGLRTWTGLTVGLALMLSALVPGLLSFLGVRM